MDLPTAALIATGVAALALVWVALRRRRRRPRLAAGARPLRVVCVGAGFGGLRLAQALDGEPVEVTLTGFLAWQAWAWLHLALLVGFRNRANVYVNWVYNYFTYDRAARLIVDRERVAGHLARAVDAPPA